MNESGPEMQDDGSEGVTRQIVNFLNTGEPPQLWPRYCLEKDVLQRGFKSYLDTGNENGLSREDKVKAARVAIVHGSLNDYIGFEDVGISKEEIAKIFAEGEISMARSMLEKLRVDSQRPWTDFADVSPDVLEWGSGFNKVDAIRNLIDKNDLTPEDIGSNEDELSELSKWKAQRPDLN